MGFLDHSTNNIILDAVLTDIGREFMSRNDGSFSIVKFAFGDDEVDYGTIKKYGRAVGREKIEKNTPIFEAMTNQNFALKFKLASISNPNLVRLPSLGLTGEGIDVTSSIISMGRSGSGSTRRLTFSQTITDEDSIDVELRDQSFIIKVPNDLLEISGRSPDSIDHDNIALYLVTRDASVTALGGSQLTFNLKVKSITDSTYVVRGNVSDKTIITTYINVTGLQSGTVKSLEVQISKNAIS
jgi:hypothetical protein